MADVSILSPIILKWEGLYSNNPTDKGNYDNKGNLIGSCRGITPATYFTAFGVWPTVEQMKNLTIEQFTYVLKKLYWNLWQADKIENQSIANILVDFCWGSGGVAIKYIQQMLVLAADGIVGNHTLEAINTYDTQEDLFNKIKDFRLNYLEKIVENNSSQSIFLKGWQNRVNSFTFEN